MAGEGGFVSLTLLDVLSDYVSARGQDPDLLFGPRPPLLPGELPRYPILKFADDLRRAKALLNDPLLPLSAGQTVKPHHLGVLGYVLQHCQTLADAQLRLERFLRLVYDGNAMQLEFSETETVIRWGIQQGYHGADVDDFLYAVLVSYARQLVAKSLTPSRVEVVNPRPENTAPYQRFYGCSIVFASDITRIGIRNQDLLLPIVAPDPSQCAMLDAEASRALSLLPSDSCVQAELREALLPLIHRGDVKLEQLASQLNCSVRTLQRRLRESGRSFQQVLDQLRFEMAGMYMDRPELELVDVALLCGFSEHSAFSRAFSRWTGESPSLYRQRRQAALALPGEVNLYS